MSVRLPFVCTPEKDDLAETGYDQNQTGLCRSKHLIRASKPANNIREFTDQARTQREYTSRYKLKDGLLYRSDGFLVIPKQLQHAVLFLECHAKPTAGHLGRRKTLSRLHGMKLCWKGMSQSVRSFVRSCRVCQQTKPSYQKKPGKMLTSTSTRPWETVAVDLMGPFPKSHAGHEYILVAVDHFSRFTEILPTTPLKRTILHRQEMTRIRQGFAVQNI